jgi:drug/metabolite transporter (DMT)-like permease
MASMPGMSMRRRAVMVWVVLGFVWGATWLFIKTGLHDLPPFSFAAWRFVLALLPLALLMRWRRVPFPTRRTDWLLLAGSGLLGFPVGYGLVFWGEKHISSGLTAILFTSYPLFGVVLAHLLVANERLTIRKTIGVLTGIGGVALIFGDGLALSNPGALAGAAAVVVSAVSSALGAVLIKRFGAHLDPLVITVVQMAVGVVPLIVLGVALEGDPLRLHWTPMALVSLAYLAFVGSSFAFVLWYWLIRTVEVGRAQLLPLFNTLVAVLLGWLVLGEPLGWRELAGGTAILVGLAVAVLRPGWRPRRD